MTSNILFVVIVFLVMGLLADGIKRREQEPDMEVPQFHNELLSVYTLFDPKERKRQYRQMALRFHDVS